MNYHTLLAILSALLIDRRDGTVEQLQNVTIKSPTEWTLVTDTRIIESKPYIINGTVSYTNFIAPYILSTNPAITGRWQFDPRLAPLSQQTITPN